MGSNGIYPAVTVLLTSMEKLPIHMSPCHHRRHFPHILALSRRIALLETNQRFGDDEAGEASEARSSGLVALGEDMGTY